MPDYKIPDDVKDYARKTAADFMWGRTGAKSLTVQDMEDLVEILAHAYMNGQRWGYDKRNAEVAMEARNDG